MFIAVTPEYVKLLDSALRLIDAQYDAIYDNSAAYEEAYETIGPFDEWDGCSDMEIAETREVSALCRSVVNKTVPFNKAIILDSEAM